MQGRKTITETQEITETQVVLPYHTLEPGIESHRLEIEQKKYIDSGSSRKTSASSISNRTESKYLEMAKDI